MSSDLRLGEMAAAARLPDEAIGLRTAPSAYVPRMLLAIRTTTTSFLKGKHGSELLECLSAHEP